MGKLEQRGPFLLLFALQQQLSGLLAQAMAQAPLSPSDFAVYSALRLMEPTTPTELATTLGMRATTLSSVLAKMTQQAHIRSQRNPADGRSRLISLTEAGRSATEDCFPAFGRAIRAFLQHLTIDEQHLLRAFEAASVALHDAAADLANTVGASEQQAS